MKRIISALAVLTAVSSFAGCGGDDDDDTGGAGSGNSAGKTSTSPGEGGAGGTASVPGAGGGDPGSGNVPCDPEQATTCQNETDCPFVEDGSARGAAQTCGQGECLGEGEECARDCMLRTLDMSSDCAGCYAAFVQCTIGSCLADCIQDPNSAGCGECQVSSGCRPTFDECSGLGG